MSNRVHVLKAEDAKGITFGLEPKAFTFQVPEKMQEVDDNFKISELVAQTSGLTELQKKSQQELVEAEVLKKLKEVQEKAYAEAHALGMEDGKKQAFENTTDQINQMLKGLTEIIETLSQFREKLFLENEESFVKLIFKISETLVQKTVAEDKTVIAGVLKRAINDIQVDEEITVRLSKEDYDFLNSLTESKDRPWEGSKKVKLEVASGITRGGCIVETNHGVIDAGLDQRLQKAWTSINNRIPKEDAK